jgi:exodeoxyribonuclease V alpha subunit
MSEPFSSAFCAMVKQMTVMVIPASDAAVPLADALVVLKKNYRFQASSQIGIVSDCINAGNGSGALAVLTDQAATGVMWHDLPAPDLLKRSLAEQIVEHYRLYLTAASVEEALASLDSFRILCALREGPYGVSGVTVLVEELLAEQGLIDPRSCWYKGRPILITANDYGLRLFNGDVGIVFPDPDADGALRVFFPESDGGGVRKVSPVRLPDHQTVYAMTIHKSQGSEFDRVLMLLPDHDTAVLTRELIYTGITRAKKDVIVWGTRELFVNATARTIGRASGLMDALWML